MNRAFKKEFHNGGKDEKCIVLMQVAVRNGKLFNALDEQGKENLINALELFKRQVDGFISDIKSKYQ